jgi:hypothetical protein
MIQNAGFLKKTIAFSLLVLFFLTSGYGTFYCMAKKLVNNAAFELADLKSLEEEQQEEKEEKEKENDKNGYYHCFFEYDEKASGMNTGNTCFRDGSDLYPASDYRTEIFSPPESAFN